MVEGFDGLFVLLLQRIELFDLLLEEFIVGFQLGLRLFSELLEILFFLELGLKLCYLILERGHLGFQNKHTSLIFLRGPLDRLVK